MLRELVEDRYVLGVTNIQELQQTKKMDDCVFSNELLKGDLGNDISGYTTQTREAFDVFEAVLSGFDQRIAGLSVEKRRPGYIVNAEGVVECYNQEEIKAQEGLLGELMSQSATALFTGRGIVGISLPVRIFEPVSLLEREARYWSYVPFYLKKAASLRDPLERFKLVAMIGLSGC